MNRTLVVTNDFPPRQGGIQSFVYEVTRRLPPGSVVTYASNHPGAAQFDAAQTFPVVRHPTGLLLPTPAARARVSRTLREFGCDSVWFGAAAPLGLLAPALRREGANRLVATTHGHEVGWAALPVARAGLRRIADGCDVVTYLGEYTRSRLAPVMDGRTTLMPLTPGVDIETFTPAVDGSAVRAQYGLTDRPIIVCVSRLVPRKGQDTLIEVLPQVLLQVPDVVLLIVGSGPYRADLEKLAEQRGVREQVVFTGSVPYSELPAHFAAGDVFAMPCRTRRHGLDVEGLGIVYLEASAIGLPVVAGDSGGAPDAVRDGETGFVVGGRDRATLTERLIQLLLDRELRLQLGTAGRSWVEREWTWDLIAERLAGMLAP
jgi:phosphatidylinositol alpha-1,6-mannosyltransferase